MEAAPTHAWPRWRPDNARPSSPAAHGEAGLRSDQRRAPAPTAGRRRLPHEPVPASLFRGGPATRFVLFDGRGHLISPEAVETVWISRSDLPALDEFLLGRLGVISRGRAVPNVDLAWAIARVLYACASAITPKTHAPGNPVPPAAVEAVAAAAVDLALRGAPARAALLLSFGAQYEQTAHACERALLALILAVHAGISRRADLEAVVIAGLYADAGEAVAPLAVPGPALDRPPVDATGEALERRHPVYATQLLRRAGITSPLVLQAVRGHHERWDGRGYPDGLRGEAILREARIVAVADAFTALTVDRSSGPGLSAFEAVREMSMAAGRFDPHLLRCLVELLAHRADVPPAETAGADANVVDTDGRRVA